MRNHHLPRIILCSKLYASLCNRGVPKKWFKSCLKKSFGACHIDHYQWSTLAENHDMWHLTINYVFSFKNTHRAALKDKRNSKMDCSTMQSSCSYCNHACLNLILSVTNVPAVSVDWSFLGLRFTKPSHEWMKYSGKYRNKWHKNLFSWFDKTSEVITAFLSIFLSIFT